MSKTFPLSGHFDASSGFCFLERFFTIPVLLSIIICE